MFAHLARADLARLEREAPAQLAARFTTDATIIRDSLTRAVNGVADAVTVVGLVASMLYLDWLLSLVAAAMYPLAAVPIQNIGKRIRRASGGMQERMGETAAKPAPCAHTAWRPPKPIAPRAPSRSFTVP
jgi:subfamily B ATP-binding cassette protein MsbA